ncbi:SusC/RagA family TonB-linked outer membrane protein [Chitinophaga cymbidii]|uniref:SusC/RagA family TonB-linked outer membrane protein n=2 Tax=Chitinophaga cymbidii TaxID=1096750 RepID=A0A512REY8_9BACT|nr:SusC/RagA family TonB-linked outer membrane protein [Chitinophaga cymbidii]
MVAAQTTTGSEDTTLRRATGKGVTVSGKVTDAATRKAAVNVRVGVENFSAAITDADGRFVLNVPSLQSTIFVSGEGYDTRLVSLRGRNNLEVSLLDASAESFSAPVNLPLDTRSKRNVTASAGQYNVNGWQQTAEMPDALLQGRIAGLNAIRRSGVQGAGANLFLRGYNSLYGTNRPLIVVDNMIFDANDYGQSIIANNYTNPLSLIDPRDIDNITVLRDAASIYGAKGANGAIIITTSRTREQATKIDFGAYAGFNIAPKRLPVMNAADYRTYLSEMLGSKGLSSAEIAALPYMNDDPASPFYHSYHYNTDWQSRVMDNSMSNNYYLKVTGGDNIATYGLSMGYMKNEGIMRGTDLSRYSTRFNAVFNFTRKFTGFANLSFTYNEQNLKDQGIADNTAPLFLSLVKSPFMHDREVNNEGVESPNLSDRDSLGISNPTAVIDEMQAYNKYYRFYGTFGFKYDFSDHWNASTTIGIVYDKVRENIFVPGSGLAKDTLPQAIAENRLGSQVKRLYSIYNDTRLEFTKRYNNRHSVAVRVGFRYQKNDAEQDYALGYNSPTDELVSVQNGLAALRQVGGGIGKWNWLNTYLNADYGLMDKYFLSFNMAVDGSSRFGKQAKDGIAINGSKFPVMPSLAAAWLISGEDFMSGSGINLLKLRASYSITANDDIGNYTSRQTYGSQNLLGMQGLVRNGIANPALQWETGKKLNGGLDIAFLQERLNIGLDVYSNKTENMLVYEELPSATGFKTMLTNAGSMQNTGWEATVNARIVNAPKVKWDLGFNVSSYKNRIISVPGGQFTTEYAGATILTANDQPANQFYGYTTNGVYASDAEAAAEGLRKMNNDGTFSTFSGGDVRFIDINKDGEINADDRRVIGDPNPDWTGGITNRILWNRFELNALITFSQGNEVYNYLRYRLESASGVENQLESMNNRWRADGQVTNTPKAAWGDPMGNARFSDRWIEDGSYLRLRTVSLQYYIPIKNGILKNATVYATGNNLITLTKYKGYDPEFSAAGSVFAQGIDAGLDPLFKSVTLGVRIGL